MTFGIIDHTVPHSGSTGVIFIIGDPIAQVRSPSVLTPLLRQRGADLIVIPAKVAAAEFRSFVAAVEAMQNTVGLIITVPHKFAAFELCSEIESPAARVGSVNLMRRLPNGGWLGTMTDGEGCLAALQLKGFEPSGKRVLLLGAGGAGVAVADSLLNAGINELYIQDLDPHRCQKLIDTLNAPTGRVMVYPPAHSCRLALVVNATLLGTAADDPLPISLECLTGVEAVADLACGPGGKTALIEVATTRGLLTMTGDEMFVAMANVVADFFLNKPETLASEQPGLLHQSGARLRLGELLNGYQSTQAIHVAAVLGVADHLSEIPLAIDELAELVEADSTSLYRLMRALAALGIFNENTNKEFSIAPLGAWLRSDADPSVRPWAMFLAEPSRWQTWGNLLHNVQTGENSFKTVHGVDCWEYRRRHPEQAALFQAAMTTNSRWIDQQIAVACKIEASQHIGDIGGGEGSLLTEILRIHPQLKGTLFDQPHVVDRAKTILNMAGVLDRCRVIGGDLFSELPQGCDMLILKYVLHDWNDSDCIAILKGCQQAIKTGSKVIVIEYILAPPNRGLHAKMSDLNMMLGPGGKERTVDEYRFLLSAAGLSLVSVEATSTMLSILTAVAT